MPEGREKGEQVAKGAFRPTQVQVSLRVAQIYAFLRDGQRTSEIYKLVAKMREIELKQKEDHEKGGLDRAGVRVPEPLVIWGNAPVPSTRTVDYYIAKAKEKIAEDGRELSKQGEYVLGAQYARVLDVYARALSDKKYHAALRAIEIVNRMFGLEGVVKVQLLPPTDGEQQSSVKTPQKVAEMTPESAFIALNDMMSRALARAQQAGHLPADATVERILRGQPIAVIAPNKEPTP